MEHWEYANKGGGNQEIQRHFLLASENVESAVTEVRQIIGNPEKTTTSTGNYWLGTIMSAQKVLEIQNGQP